MTEPAAARLAVADPFADWPKDEVAAVDERATLIGFLDYLRAVLARKAAGLTEAEARRAACPPSDLTIIGLVRHMADVERGWGQRSAAGLAVGHLFDGDADFNPPADATLAEALDLYWREIEAADAVYASAALDDLERSRRGEYSVRWILVHLVEEYARHCGHADLIRQAIDGAIGD